MAKVRNCRSSYGCIVKSKGVTLRPILFSQLTRCDGEGPLNAEALFQDDSVQRTEEEMLHEDELRALMSDIIEWAISFLRIASKMLV